MNKQTLTGMWDLMRQRHGIALRAIAALPEDKLDSHPIPNMRTPKELVVHTYDMCIKTLAESVVRGEVIDTEAEEKAIAAKLRTKADLLRFANECWTAADKAVATVTDAQLAAEVKTPWGKNFPGAMIFGITHDEFLHHRGQLYAYLRALGVEPPMVWDFANNEPAYQPQAKAHA